MALRTKKLLTTLPVLVALAAVAVPRDASAQEIQLTGPLKGAPAVRNLRLYREGRVEIAPTFTATLLDEYRRTLLVGARINYGITDWLSVGVWGAFGAVGISTSITDQIDANAQRNEVDSTGATVPSLTAMNVPGKRGQGLFQGQVAQLSWLAMPQLTAVPFRGKFALFQSIFADVDAYIFAGFGVVGTQEREDCKDFVTCAQNHKLASHLHPAPTWGLGFNFYLNKFLSLGFEYRMIPFAWNRSGFDSRGKNADGTLGSSGKFPDYKIDDSDNTYKFNQMMTISIGFAFPMTPTVTD